MTGASDAASHRTAQALGRAVRSSFLPPASLIDDHCVIRSLSATTFAQAVPLDRRAHLTNTSFRRIEFESNNHYVTTTGGLIMRTSAFLITCLGSLLALAPAEPAQAWGKLGHLTICDLAYRNLTQTSRDEVKAILRSNRGGITIPARGRTQPQHYTSFNFACLEEDEVPRRNPDDHFINLPRTATILSSSDCPPAAAQGECILKGLQRDLAVLRDRRSSAEDRAFALMAVGHWVGDLHQPLHVSFADDRGGNGIDAKVDGGCGVVRYRPDKLHAVWDNCLLEAGLMDRVRRRADYRASWSRFTVTYRAVDTLLANTTLAQEQTLTAGEPWDWAAESYEITLDPAVRYCVRNGTSCAYSTSAVTLTRTGPRRIEQIDQAYLAQFAPIAEERLRKAGFRLAHLLNQALDPQYAGPTVNGLQQP